MRRIGLLYLFIITALQVFAEPEIKLTINHSKRSLTFCLPANNFDNYEIKLTGVDLAWKKIVSNKVIYEGLKGGSYTFYYRTNSTLNDFNFEVEEEGFWTSTHLLGFGIIAALGLTTFVAFNHSKKSEKVSKAQLQQQLSEMEMKALRAQMSPHFIFNSLNSINRYILKSDAETASVYLTKFARLIRLILENSNHKVISLEAELHAIKLYIELEMMRFNKKFDHAIFIDPKLKPSLIGIPPMIIQPFIENAIWHGLLHKESPGMLKISIEQTSSGIQCVIEDNGVGRKKAKELRSKSITKEKSFGMQITRDRLSLIKNESKFSTVDIVDLKDDIGNATGTRVIVDITKFEMDQNF